MKIFKYLKIGNLKLATLTAFIFSSLILNPLSLISTAYAAIQPAPPVQTAFGNFPTDPGGFVGKLFSIILTIAAIGAIILFIVGGFQLGLSQGNQEKAQGAKETITSAVTGLIFVIFSATLLKIIGINVLGLDTIFGK